MALLSSMVALEGSALAACAESRMAITVPTNRLQQYACLFGPGYLWIQEFPVMESMQNATANAIVSQLLDHFFLAMDQLLAATKQGIHKQPSSDEVLSSIENQLQ
eukprot:4313126-Amphidinium_carterae.3